MFTINKLATRLASAGIVSVALAAPLTGHAQTITHWVQRQTHTSHQHTDWKSLSFVGGGVAVVGILTHSPALVGLGIAGGLYSAWRYEQDRHSHNARDRHRYAYFSKPYRTIDGHRCKRVVVMQHGHRYYAYKRV